MTQKHVMTINTFTKRRQA